MDFKLVSKYKTDDLVFDARFHPTDESGLFAAVTIAGNVNLYRSGRLEKTLSKHHKGSSIRKVRFNNSGHLVTIAKTVKVHDLVANKTLTTIKRDSPSPVQLYSVKPFGQNIISAGDDDGALYVWDARIPHQPIFSSHDCEQYISDIDGRYEVRKLIVCTSGEGTLTAYDMRAKKMIEPQSELFEAGFQCLRMVDLHKKVVIGGEDGAIYVFNQSEWAHTSGKFAVGSDAQNRGKCSIDCLEVLPDETTFIAGCSDGRIRALSLWPHQIISESARCRKSPLESLHLNPAEGKSELLICGENNIEIVSFQEKESESDSDSSQNEGNTAVAKETKTKVVNEHADSVDDERPKKLKAEDTEDYLNLFS